MAINSVANLKSAHVAELHLHIPAAYVVSMRRQQITNLLVGYTLSATWMAAFASVFIHNWGEVLSALAFPIFIGLAMSLLNTPWIGVSSKNWEWYYNEYGLCLKDVKNPITFYGIVFISTKRDKIISAEQTNWQEYPALKISWRYGGGKIKEGLFVYEPAQNSLILEGLMPQLLAWPQNGKTTA